MSELLCPFNPITYEQQTWLFSPNQKIWYKGDHLDPLWIKGKETFEDELEFAGLTSGQSSVRMVLSSRTTPFKYSLFWKHFGDVIPKMQNGIIQGKWALNKKGSNYGLIWVSE